MDIRTSLAITEKNPDVISLISAGTFVRVYNQSYYLMTIKLNRSLKPIVNYVKSANNRFVIYGAFPAKLVNEYYPNAIKTLWGYKIIGDFDLAGYHDWLIECEAKASIQLASGTSAASLPATAVPKNKQEKLIEESILNVAKNSLSNSQDNHKMLKLNALQYAFLTSWQQGLYPSEVEQGFIESLQETIEATKY